MPQGKPSDRQRSKEQTWKEDELKKSLKEINDENKKPSRGDGDKRRSDRDKDSSRSKDDKDRHRDDRDRHRSDRDKEKHRDDKERDRHRDDRDRRRDDKDRDRHRDDKDQDRHRDDKDRDRHKDDRDRQRGDKDKERRRDGQRDRHRDDKDKDKHRDDRERERRKDDKERDRNRDEKDRERHRDSKDHERRREERDRDRHRDDNDRQSEDRERRREEKDRDRHRDGKDRDDKDRRHREERDRDHRRDEKERDKERGDKGTSRHREEKERSKNRDEKERSRHREERERRGDDGEGNRDQDRHRDGKGRDRKREERENERHRDGKEERRDKKDDDREERKRDREKRRDEERDNRSKERSHHKSDRESDTERHKRREERDDSRRRDESSRRRSDKVKNEQEYESEEKHVESKVERSSKENGKPKKSETLADEEGSAENYDEYADDFEDYDEDFEDFEDEEEETDNREQERFRRMDDKKSKSSNKEMEDLFDALNKENDRLLSESRKSDWSDSTEDDRNHRNRRPETSKPRSFINFVAAKQRDLDQKVASKARKRCTELLQIIELDTVHMSLFDLPPVKEYDLYISSFGRTNAQQVAVQTNDDNLERETQTEDIESNTKWTQHPQETSQVCGSADLNGEKDNKEYENKLDETKLNSFLQRACQVIEKLIEEENVHSVYSEKSSNFSCTDGYIDLKSIELFNTRPVVGCSFSSTDSHMLLTMHGEPTQVVDKDLDKYGMIGVWNINDPRQPQKIVSCASFPTCCCFSPIKATLVFAGMRDGSVLAWDLREPPTMHHSFILRSKDWLLRFPTYNTAGVLKYENHTSPVTSLVPIVMDGGKSGIQEAGLGLSFQLASLDKNGHVHLWVVTEIQETNQAGSESDLGLSPNGKIKLLKSSTIPLENPNREGITSLCTLDLKLNLSNPNHFYVATDSGSVIHGTRFGRQKTIPRCYLSDTLTPCPVTSIDLHPFGHPVLLAGCEDGSLHMYHLSSESPLVTWDSFTNGAGIRKVVWSKNSSYIIFILDNKSVIYMWDLLRNDAEPMTSDIITSNNSRCVDIELSTDRQTNSRPKMVLSFEDGTIQVHMLGSHVSKLQPGEDEQFTRFIEQL